MTFEVRQGDCVELMQQMEPCSVEAVVCDPPYGLEFMGKDWDRLDKTHWEAMEIGKGGRTDGRNVPMFQLESPRYDPRKQGGPVMQEWHQAWATEALRVLKPGGFLLAFGGTRTVHRLACAIEDSGFEIRDTILNVRGGAPEPSGMLAWIYGSG